MPPKAKRSKTPDSQFLFVNEDASTVTRTSKDAVLDRTKQSHVQRQNFARKRRLREQSDPVPQVSSQGSVPPSPGLGDSSTQEGLPNSANYFDMLQSIDLGDPLFQSTSPMSMSQSPLDPRLAALFSDPFAATPTSPPITSHIGTTYAAQAYRPGQYFDAPPSGYSIGQATRSPDTITSSLPPLGRVSSPPTSTHRALEQWAPPLIKYYNTVILPEKFWKDTQKVPLAQFRHAPLIHADMQACMAEPAHMYSLLASAAAQMISREGRLLLPNVSGEDTDRVTTFFKIKAMQASRSKLASGQFDHHTAIDVHRLYVVAILLENLEAAEPHLQSLLSMIDALGGLDTFDGYQLEKLVIMDCNTALARLGVPRLVVVLDPGSLPEEIMSDAVSLSPHRFPPGSMLEALFESFPQCAILFESFADLIEVVGVSTYMNSHSNYVHEHYRWFSSQTLVILHRLLSLPLHCEMDNKVDSARIATAYWIAVLRSPSLGRRTASKSVSTLRAKLETTELDSLWQPHTNFLLWISIFGGICCVEDEDLDWFVQLARTAAAELGIEDVKELEDLLAAFLYDVHSQRELVLQFAARIWPSG